MSKQARQYLGLLCALLSYYVIHEGAHLICALSMGVFKQINFMGLGIQIDVYHEQMSDLQMGIFCLVGALASLVFGYGLVAAASRICKSSSKAFKASMYYITIAMLLLDPLYLSILSGFFGGGDMNGIALLIPEWMATAGFGLILVINGLLFWKVVLPQYKKAFS